MLAHVTATMALVPGVGMPAALYDAGPHGLPIFLAITVVLGGLAAFVSGRALAQTWRPMLQIVGYVLLLAAAVRFVHFSVFGEPLLSLRSYLVDLIILSVLALAGYSFTRKAQMEAQYGWRKESDRAR
ncbi:MAG: DUF6867 family protein [Hyphomicrobiaceae bacterium]